MSWGNCFRKKILLKHFRGFYFLIIIVLLAKAISSEKLSPKAKVGILKELKKNLIEDNFLLVWILRDHFLCNIYFFNVAKLWNKFFLVYIKVMQIVVQQISRNFSSCKNKLS